MVMNDNTPIFADEEMIEIIKNTLKYGGPKSEEELKSIIDEICEYRVNGVLADMAALGKIAVDRPKKDGELLFKKVE